MAATVLGCEGLAKSYKSKRVLSQVVLETSRHEVVAVLGPNGAGKSTLFGLLAGILRPDAGRVNLLDRDLNGLSLAQRALLGLAYVPQSPSVFRRASVFDNLTMVLLSLGKNLDELKPRAEELCRRFQLWELRHQMGATLSGGERRKLEIARALMGRPKLLLLDEPFSGLDPKTVQELHGHIRSLAGEGVSILITDHNAQAILQLAHRGYVLAGGEICAQGDSKELANSSLVQQVYLGVSQG